MYIKAAKEYLKEIKPTLEESGKTKEDLAVKDFNCSFDASLECSIKNGTFKMKVDYIGATVTSFELLEEPVNGSYIPYSIDEIAREIDANLCDLKEEYGF